MSFIEAKEVYYRYPQAEKDALCGVDLTVEKGEYVAVIGHNGSGKSTLARLLNGLLQPTKGEIFVDGISAADKKTLFELRKRVGVVFQNPDNQLVASIVEDDVAFGPENIGVPHKEIGEAVLQRFWEVLQDIGQVEKPAFWEGKWLKMNIGPKKK